MHIAILSRNNHLYSTRRLVEEGLNRGHKTEVVDHLKCNIVIEKKNPRIFYKNRYLDDVDAIIPRIGASVTYYGSAVCRQFEMRDRKSTRLNSSHIQKSRMPSSA